ncbi:P-loop containing nucleoside triphosphate hydrolases superfamily protein isoform X2 [Tasmannia lanceolata]|uniref:P-loop containing nucleoside triphosphate hydrolases superfamily protein isoform X2 n=1 Tax=Tasmannia lanceolata TaxID=3420 RepID=UPI004063ADA4
MIPKLCPNSPKSKMAPKSLISLSFSSSPLSLPYKLKNPNLSFKNPSQKFTRIICRTDPHSKQQPISETPLSIPTNPSDGIGAAAKTRGELFLEHQQSVNLASIELGVKKKKRKKKSDAVAKLSSAIACCYGCGAPLQTVEVDAPGYVDSETYELKKRHHQLRTILCGRCKLLSHGHMITAVGGNGGYPGGKQFISAEELREKLSHLRHEKVLIVKLVDIVDFNGSFLARIRDLAGANPIILVVTKVDLLPKGTDLNCVGDWVVESTTKKKLNVLSVHLSSSKSLVGIAGVASAIQKEKKGSANVGKSAFINAMLQMMAQKDSLAAAAQKYKPMQSAVPGTTLGPIQIDAFQGGGKLFDTPGVHLHHRQAAVVHSEDLPSLAPQSRLRAQSFPTTSDKRTPSEVESIGLNGLSIFWGGLVRIDVIKVLPQTRLAFYGPKALQIYTVPTLDAEDFYHKELGVLLTPPTGKQRAEEWLGLKTVRQLQLKFEDQKSPACDIAISGLGWIAVDLISKQPEISDSIKTSEELHLTVHVPKPVEIFVRPPMPVGKGGGEWYEFRELTEKEEELRPKWYI